ncbi:copper amine oxidase [Niveomyces insectorum RCEF 264]|uniref:Amine oxidase n=1 Tax=Niveomyces insectorum RCEF 264 TaxID=1081102 RepID=A0A167TA70_9HYPO|nr:copper amine oxidase [Niveomyces insectorum RCEF 264]
MAVPHPFDPISPGEIELAVRLLNAQNSGTRLRFKRIDVREPIKKSTIPYLEAERLKQPLPRAPPRYLFALYHRLDNHLFFKATIDAGARRVVENLELPQGIQGPADIDEMIELEQVCNNHPAVKAEIAKMKLPEGYAVVNDPWIYGTDNSHETRRLVQCYMYIRDVDHPESNHYSLPCAFSPVFDQLTHELVRIDYLPTRDDASTAGMTTPWKPVKAVQYAQDLIDEPLRTDLKPYIVQQPEGASFRVDGQLVEWQKWRFRVGFNNREGLILYNVTYDGRNVLYRLAVSEMTVPYGDPRRPYHRKQAFDAGDVGFGVTANELTLGCDCLGHIMYFNGCRCDARGNPVVLRNVVCLHEQDAGLQTKHTNYRNGVATVVRNRQLVVQMICTVSNYEYIFAYIFDQAGGIELEVRATGILSTMPIDYDEKANAENSLQVRWGTNVGPGVMAAYHQHMFSLRIDPAVDGFDNNTVFYEESVPLPITEHLNPYGAGYVVEETTVRRAGAYDTDVAKHRVYKIRNDNVINPVSGKPVAYKVGTVASQMLLMGPDSYNAKRAQFATRPVWVTTYRDDELYAAGEFTNQSLASDGVEIWSGRQDNTENTDVVFWHTFGLTHNPRVEDFPVMPVEKISVLLRPDGFFDKNPALDVPASNQGSNRSVLHQTETSAAPRANRFGSPCCKI